MLANFQIADLLGGSLTPVMGILAAVIDAKSTGQGRYVDVAMTDAVLAHAVVALSGVAANGAASPRGGDRLSGALPCYNVYRTRDDRYLAIGALEQKVLGDPMRYIRTGPTSRLRTSCSVPSRNA